MTADLEINTDITVIVKRGIAPLIQVEVEPAGSWYHQYEHNRLHGTGDDKVSESDNSDDSKERESKEKVIEDDIAFLRSLDPSKWKDQDHYRVLGLHKYRFKATDEDMKRAYRQMVLKHHPDKRRGAGEDVRDGDDYFTNITKAYENLGDPIKRRAYDSVDPDFDDKVPGDKLNNKDKFYEVFDPIFERNSRWSLRKHVPQLGKPTDSKEKVDLFYDFWYNLDSWREFSYLDEEDKEKGEDRYDRRWIEKQNRAERLVRKKEESARIRKLVDNSYKLDPRVIKFRDEEREKKLSQKRARKDAVRQREEQGHQERQKAEDEERKRKEKEGQENKVRLAKEKKERDVVKNKLKSQRKIMRGMCKEADYFVTDERDRVQAMMDVEMLCDGLQLLQLKDLITRVTSNKDDKEQTRKIIKQEVTDLRSGKLENINITHINTGSVSQSSGNKSKTTPQPVVAVPVEKTWSAEELQLLIKAVNLFPAGTAKRWDVVAQYLSQHGPNKTTRNSKEVLSKAKEMQNSDTCQFLKDAANKNSVSQIVGVDKKMEKLELLGGSSVTATASERLETPSEMLGMNLSPWTSEEQARLEQALKTFPANTDDRWEKVADSIPGRGKKDCMRRYKELAEMVRAKRAAMLAAGVKK
uniref:DnaJ homolog subfamily C member 2-like n=1 Tax=Hirondellea gigas TaxID=1518452 RepID=A0A2P2HZQ3_9CRUS